MDGGNLGRAKFLKTVTKEQPMRRVCAVVEEGGGGVRDCLAYVVKSWT